MGLIDVIRRTVKRELKNIEELTVNIIRPGKERQDLLLENGSGASVKLSGDSVYINGIDSGGLGGLGGASLWTAGDTKNEPFEYTPWGARYEQYFQDVGRYKVVGFLSDDCTFADTDYIMPTAIVGDDSYQSYTTVLIDSGEVEQLTTGSKIILEDGYTVYMAEANESGQVWVKIRHDGIDLEDVWVTAPATVTYRKTVAVPSPCDDVYLPILAVHIKQVFTGTESTAVEIDGIFQICDGSPGTSGVVTVVGDTSAAKLVVPRPIDTQGHPVLAGGGTVGGSGVNEGYSMRLAGYTGVSVGVSDSEGYTEALRVTHDKIDPKVPIDMGTLSITTSKDTFAANELVDKEYVDALVNTSQYWTTLSGMARMLSAKPLDMAGYAITGLPTQSGTLNPNDAATIGYVNDNVGGGVTVHNDLTGRDAVNCHGIGAITDLQTTLNGKLSTSGTAYNSNRLGNSYYTNYSKTTHVHTGYLPSVGDIVFGGSITVPDTAQLDFGGTEKFYYDSGFKFDAAQHKFYTGGNYAFGILPNSIYINRDIDMVQDVDMNGGRISDVAMFGTNDKFFMINASNSTTDFINLLFMVSTLQTEAPTISWKKSLNAFGFTSNGTGTYANVYMNDIYTNGKVHIGDENDTYIENRDGNMVFHVAAGKGIIFEEG